MAPRYLLAPSITFCYVGDVSISFDRYRNLYKYNTRRKTELLKKMSEDHSQNAYQYSIEEKQLIENMVENGFLTTDVNNGIPIQPFSRATPSRSIAGGFERPMPSLFVLQQLWFFHRQASKKIATESMGQILEEASTLKSSARSSEKSLDSNSVLWLSEKLISSRRFLYTHKDRCLYDSLTIFLYLVKRGIPIDWVFGTTLFHANSHCWVEYEGVILNDTLDSVGGFTPIFSV